MAVFKIEKNSNYTVMSNYRLKDKNLSYKAKGLLSFMLSLPDDWDYSINGLVAISKEGVKAIRNIQQELQKYGYLVIKKKQNEVGQFKDEDGNFIKNKYGYFKNAIIGNINRLSIEIDDLWENRDDLLDLYDDIISNDSNDLER